jgi:hypothetical protein
MLFWPLGFNLADVKAKDPKLIVWTCFLSVLLVTFVYN